MRRSISHTIILIACMAGLTSKAQESQPEEIVSTYIHISEFQNNNWSEEGQTTMWPDPIGFVLKNKDTLGNFNWQSGIITQFDKDKGGFFLKIDLPLSVAGNSKEMWCTAIGLAATENGPDTVRFSYGGIKLSKIILYLSSTPEGAYKYLIPNRIWTKKFEHAAWEKDSLMLERFLVTGHQPPKKTYALVDETVFMVVYKLGNRIKKVYYPTKPASTENPQSIWVQF